MQQAFVVLLDSDTPSNPYRKIACNAWRIVCHISLVMNISDIFLNLYLFGQTMEPSRSEGLMLCSVWSGVEYSWCKEWFISIQHINYSTMAIKLHRMALYCISELNIIYREHILHLRFTETDQHFVNTRG